MIRRIHGKMRIKEEDFDLMLSGIRDYITKNPDMYRIYREGKEPPRLMSWFFLRACKIEGNSTTWICNVLYKYLNDTHIQTALNRCMSIINNEVENEKENNT